MVTLPRLVVAAAQSGTGKTTLTMGLMAALCARGLDVAPGKVGPDYIDPGYHAAATGRPGRNLDPHLVGEDLIVPLLLHGARDADVALVEGVMGLFDGRLGTGGFGSTAHVARLIDAPVLLVVDAAHTSRTVGALVQGMASFDPRIRIAGVLLNRAGSPRNVAEITAALTDLPTPDGARTLPVVGAVPRSSDVVVASRHLGLVPAEERGGVDDVVASARALVEGHVDLDAVLALAASAPALDAAPWDPDALVTPVSGRPRIAVAGGRAFTFRYPETVELLEAAGCEAVAFDPLTDATLPDGTAGLYLGGGFPEMHADQLAGNASLRADVAAAVQAGMPTVAECAGLLYLGRTLDGTPMSGALPHAAAMAPRLTLRYEVEPFASDSVIARAGEPVRFHEFHRTAVDPAEADPTLTATVHASYKHVHWAGHPAMAQRFADAAARFASTRADSDFGARSDAMRAHAPQTAPIASRNQNLSPSTALDLDHHGDRDAVPGLVDLAVNVRRHTPAWLAAELARPDTWVAYPNPDAARAALAARHGVPVECVLPTAGAAEAFTLVARSIEARHPVVVHPQFSEPDAALARAGRPAERLELRAPFTLAEAPVADADLVFVGNPTNPTGVLHPAATLRAWRRPGRVLVVDEAFMDFVPGEPESLLGDVAHPTSADDDLRGVLVIRSLTKIWGLAGLRAGYVVGDPELIARLAAQQSPWSVSTPAARAMELTATPDALADARGHAEEVARARGVLVEALRRAGFPVSGDPQTPFVLLDTGSDATRARLADAGFAVRRGETFPGLGPTWIRVAVRDDATNAAFVDALVTVRGDTRDDTRRHDSPPSRNG